MDQRTRPAPRLAPLPADHTPELKDHLEVARQRMGFIPNSMLIMQRNPKLTKAFGMLSAAIWDPDGKVDRKLKRLISHVASRAAGCQYCMAHTAEGAAKFGVDDQKLDAVWDYQTSPLFSPAERAALDLAVAASSVPNAVTDEMFLELRKHWSEDEIVEILGVVAMFGFLNRWNDSMATPLEPVAAAAGEKFFGARGWRAGKHER